MLAGLINVSQGSKYTSSNNQQFSGQQKRDDVIDLTI